MSYPVPHHVSLPRFAIFSCALLLWAGCGQDDRVPIPTAADAGGRDASSAEVDAGPVQSTPPHEGSTCVNSPTERIPLDLTTWSQDVLESTMICDSNSDCTERAHGYCEWLVPSHVPATRCNYGCETDADCGPHAVCDCGSAVGRCVTATCTSSADCGGDPCVRFDEPSVCVDGYRGAGVYYDCMSPDDECNLSSECAEDEVCSAYDKTNEKTFSRRCQMQLLCGF